MSSYTLIRGPKGDGAPPVPYKLSDKERTMVRGIADAFLFECERHAAMVASNPPKGKYIPWNGIVRLFVLLRTDTERRMLRKPKGDER